MNKIPVMKWFDPMEGISLIEAMTQAFDQHKEQFVFPEHLREDLNAFHSILDRAAGAGLRWNLTMSY
jgi:hypothetical protein